MLYKQQKQIIEKAEQAQQTDMKNAAKKLKTEQVKEMHQTSTDDFVETPHDRSIQAYGHSGLAGLFSYWVWLWSHLQVLIVA